MQQDEGGARASSGTSGGPTIRARASSGGRSIKVHATFMAISIDKQAVDQVKCMQQDLAVRQVKCMQQD